MPSPPPPTPGAPQAVITGPAAPPSLPPDLIGVRDCSYVPARVDPRLFQCIPGRAWTGRECVPGPPYVDTGCGLDPATFQCLPGYAWNGVNCVPLAELSSQPGLATPAAYERFAAYYNGKYVNVSRNPYGAQCVELANAWCDYIQIERFPGNAQDFEFDSHPDCVWVPNGPNNIPIEGDIVVWGHAPNLRFGHVGIFWKGDSMNFATFDQNWPLGSAAHMQWHTYASVRGWLSPSGTARSRRQQS